MAQQAEQLVVGAVLVVLLLVLALAWVHCGGARAFVCCSPSALPDRLSAALIRVGVMRRAEDDAAAHGPRRQQQSLSV